MSGAEELEIRFRLSDGSDIGPQKIPVSKSVSALKENILAQWPKEKDNAPRTVKDIKLISAGRILENSRPLGEYRSPLCDTPGGATTMHFVVQPPPTDKEKKLDGDTKTKRCGCMIYERQTVTDDFLALVSHVYT